MKNCLLVIIKSYQYIISPMRQPSCRFYPSCSQYSYESILNNGALTGTIQSIKRILRCHPFSKGGIDLPTNRRTL